MFIANNHHGERFSLLEIRDKAWLLEARKSETFFCPGCKGPVTLKLGEKRIPHFAHINVATCPSFSERESEYHLKGKLQLFNWLKPQFPTVELEPYLPKLKQRPDILLTIQNQKFAIEYQCSSISEKLFINRSSSYLRNGYTPIWILGATHLNRISAQNTKMSTFRWLFSQHSTRFDKIPILLYYCSVDRKFTKVSSLVPFSTNDLLANITISSLDKLTGFHQLFTIPHFNQSSLKELWLKKKQNWRNRTSPFLYKSSKRLTKELYAKRISPSCLPAEVGIPLKSLFWINTPAMIWQMYILLDSIFPLQVGDVVTFQHVYQQFQARKYKGLIKIRSLPLLHTTHYSFAIMEYLHFLNEIGVLKRTGKSTFIKMREIWKIKTIEEAEKLDQVILNQFFD